MSGPAEAFGHPARPAAGPRDCRAQRANIRAGLLFGLCAVGLLMGGCSPIEPWVKPYEREHFADPIMSFNRDPVSDSYMDHVLESREGARGATGGVGGGCGCN